MLNPMFQLKTLFLTKIITFQLSSYKPNIFGLLILYLLRRQDCFYMASVTMDLCLLYIWFAFDHFS